MGETVPVPCLRTWYLSPLAVVTISPDWPLAAAAGGAGVDAGGGVAAFVAGGVAVLLLSVLVSEDWLQPRRHTDAADMNKSRNVIM